MMNNTQRNLQSPISNTQYLQWAAFIAILLSAAFLRFYALDSIPPGLHYDEAIDAHLALDIRAGARPVFFVQGWGREPLYHYLVALAMNWLDPAMALRVTSATLGTLAVALSFMLLRELFDWRVAAIGGAWLASSFWVMSISRLGVRDVAVEPLAVGAMLALQVARRKAHIAWMILGGVLMGLSLYTYQPSRAMPVLIALWIIYLAIFARDQLARQWKGLIVFGIVAALIAAPLVIYLMTHPGAESGRNFQVEPIQQLLQGHPQAMVDHALATLKMFTFAGDPQPLYNVPGRPALAWLAGIAFYIGLIVALIRLKQQEYAFIWLWLLAALAPALITYPAPHFPRTLLAHLPVAALIGIPITVFRPDRFSRSGRAVSIILLALAILVLGQTAWQTWSDYFVTWANLKQVRFQYNAGPAAVARYLDASPDTDPVILAGLFVDDSDPHNFEVMLHRKDLDLRWFDASSALPIPSGAPVLRFVLYDFTSLDDALKSRYLTNMTQLARTDAYTVLRLDANVLRADIGRPGAPISFGDLSLVGYDPVQPIRRGGKLNLVTHWQINHPGTPQPVAIFAHLVDQSGKIVAQDDRLGYPHHEWKPGDVFAQVHHINLPSDITPGSYQLKLGVYYRDTGARWPVAGRDMVSLGLVELVSSQ